MTFRTPCIINPCFLALFCCAGPAGPQICFRWPWAAKDGGMAGLDGGVTQTCGCELRKPLPDSLIRDTSKLLERCPAPHVEQNQQVRARRQPKPSEDRLARNAVAIDAVRSDWLTDTLLVALSRLATQNISCRRITPRGESGTDHGLKLFVHDGRRRRGSGRPRCVG